MPTDYRIAASGLLLGAVVSALVSIMVWRACHRQNAAEIAINWHDLFRATHTGRVMAAAMTLVLTMRMKDSFVADHRGLNAPLTVALLLAVTANLATTAALTVCHAKARAVYMEVGRLRRIAKGKKNDW